MKKFLLATTALIATCAVAQAQVATVSTTNAAITGVNANTGLQNATGVTYFDNDGKTLLMLRNNSAAAITATAVNQQSQICKDGYGCVPLSNVSFTVPSGTTVLAGPFPTGRWNTTKGTVGVSLSTPTGVSATGLRVQ
ncbi:hypothetical protein [Tardiphaga sp.]|jgi:hypothetical protein|uniref:hypothetical protein n=1 Tax=Tardiphaga sp. TaxID=1926292 RepID=UPI0037D9997D